jgi:hypothetical protein
VTATEQREHVAPDDDASTMFQANRRSLFLDYFRIPHRLPAAGPATDEWCRIACGPRALSWPVASSLGKSARLHRVGESPIFCAVADERATAAALRRMGETWRPTLPVLDERGEAVASIWRSDDGSVLLPFDPDAAIHAYWSEAYLRGEPRRGIRVAALRGYYRVRPFLPRNLQIALRRRFARIQARRSFPRWPIERGLHELYRLLFDLLAEVANEPVPYLAPWPRPYRWALVLTHDVETGVGYRHIGLLRELELRHGYRSSWNLVPRRYDVDDRTVQELTEAGFEVGVHGLYHDGRDLESEEVLRERLPAMRAAAGRWGAVGFRSPATHRDWRLMPMLGFDYDSSYPDTDPFEPIAGGCGSLLPYGNDELVELPITLPQDHTLFVILGRKDESAWVEKALAIREEGGMALLIVHPDYMLDEPQQAAYERFLARFEREPGVWRALPREVSAWWRRRADSSLERTPDGWRVLGPAATDGVVAYAGAGASLGTDPLA